MSKKSTMSAFPLKRGVLLVWSAFLPFGMAFAQESMPKAAPDAQAPQLQTVTVTAQRRTENIREVPVSVTMLKDEKLDVMISGGQDIRVLAGKVPSLNVESSNGRTFPRFYIRGYGNTDFSTFASQPVSLIYDDVVQESAPLKGFPIFDLAGVEVLRGPQGTLFGRNTPAGVVKFESAKPSVKQVEGYYNLSMASYGTANVDGAVNLPLSKEWAMRVSTLRQHRDNFVDNTFTGVQNALEGYNEHAERIQVLYEPDSAFKALFNVHQRTTTGSARLFRANIIKKGTNDLVDDFDADKIATNGQNYQHLDTRGANARLSWDFGAVKLFSISAVESVGDYFSRGDIDGGNPAGPGVIPFQVETGGGLSDHRQVSQELRAESKTAGALNWQSGVYYFNEDATGFSNNYNSTTGAQTSHLANRQKNTAWAVFGNVNYKLSDAFTVRGGLRYTDDKKDFNRVNDTFGVTVKTPDAASESGSKINWDLNSTYRLDKDVNLYARVATGFRAPSIAAASASVPITVANAETILSYEAGIKADLFNRRGRIAFDVYDFDVKNQQLTVVGGNSNITMLINAAKTAGRGAELDFEGFLTKRLKVSAGGSYNFTRIDDPSLSVVTCPHCTVTNPLNGAGHAVINGNPLPQAPKWILNGTAKYTIPMADGDFFVFTDWSYRSEVNFLLYESKEFTGKPLLEGGLRVGYTWDEGKYEVAAYGRNITNTVRITGGIDFNNLVGFINEPRILGIQFKGNF
jgi:iron complex outermembrane recepter protein